MNLKVIIETKISDMYRGINKFKKRYHPVSNII
jgi:hypothetical protein